MSHNVLIAKGTDIYDITEFAGDISWSDSIDTLGMQLGFSIGASDERYFPKFSVDVGDIVVLRGGAEIFRGIIVTKNINIGKHSFTAFDFCYYFNKNKIIKQFNSINAAAAVSQLCAEVNVKVGGIASMRANIKHIYYDKTVAEVIEDILTQERQETGKTYLKEMRGDSFYIFERTSLPITSKFKPAQNIEAFDAALAPGNPSRTLSMEEMRNSILIVSGSEKSYRVLASAKDEAGIKKYGLLQDITSVDDKQKNAAQNIADNTLKELNRINETISVELLGDDTVRAGRVLALTEINTGIDGRYLIKTCGHSLSGGIHTMSLELEAL